MRHKGEPQRRWPSRGVCASFVSAFLVTATTMPLDNKAAANDKPSPAVTAAALRKLPGVHKVEVALPVAEPKVRIIHLLNWHFVPKKAFTADIRDVAGKPLSDAEIDEQYEAFLSEVEAVQKEQMAVLRHLIKHHGLRSVYLEGLTKRNLKGFNSFVKTLRGFKPPKGETPLETFLLEQYRRDLLELGAAGRLLVSGELKAVLPVEDAELFKAANPVATDGTVKFDKKANERREDAMVKTMLKGGKVAVIILGGGHDLTDNIRSLGGGSCQYMRVQTSKYLTATGGKE